MFARSKAEADKKKKSIGDYEERRKSDGRQDRKEPWTVVRGAVKFFAHLLLGPTSIGFHFWNPL